MSKSLADVTAEQVDLFSMTRREIESRKNEKFERFINILAKQFRKDLPRITAKETFARFYDVPSLPAEIKRRKIIFKKKHLLKYLNFSDKYFTFLQIRRNSTSVQKDRRPTNDKIYLLSYRLG